MSRGVRSLEAKAAARSLRGVRALFPIVGAVLLSLALAFPALAAAGNLDPSFGNKGMVTTVVNPQPEGNAVAIQADRKIVAVGATDVEEGLRSDFALMRYNTNGSLDNTFSGDGIVTTSFTPNDDHAFGVAIQTDGKIVVVGYSGAGTTDFNDTKLTLARYNPDGTLDATFGSGGTILTDIGPCDDYGLGLGIQADGKIVTAGIAFFGTQCDDGRFAVARYASNGMLDSTFGNGGTVTTDFTPSSDFAFGMALQTNGKIVAVGISGRGGPNPEFALARYNTNGTLDGTFGKRGKVTTDFTPYEDWGKGVAIQSDGKIVVVGHAGFGGSDPNFALARYNTDGTLDATFGGNGTLSPGFPGSIEEEAKAVAIQSDGKIVVAGYAGGGCSTCNPEFAVARVNSNGTLDSTFGVAGRVTTDFTPDQDVGSGVAIQSDGKIVVAGISKNGFGGQHAKVALVRYLAA